MLSACRPPAVRHPRVPPGPCCARGERTRDRRVLMGAGSTRTAPRGSRSSTCFVVHASCSGLPARAVPPAPILPFSCARPHGAGTADNRSCV